MTFTEQQRQEYAELVQRCIDKNIVYPSTSLELPVVIKRKSFKSHKPVEKSRKTDVEMSDKQRKAIFQSIYGEHC